VKFWSFVLSASLFADIASAQEAEPSIIDRWAEAMAESISPRWTGPRVPWPHAEPRPPAGGSIASSLHPVHVHAGSPGADAALMNDTLRALERTHEWLEAHDWPTPVPDGGAGGTAGFDLYLVDDVGSAPGGRWSDEVPADDPSEPLIDYARESMDAPLVWGGLDGAATYVRMRIDPERVEACAISAYVRAALFSADPAEAASWRLATGDYVAWLLTGSYGCSDDGLVRAQAESWRTWVGERTETGHGGALFLTMLSARTDGLTGDFIRDLWSGAPQHTWEGEGLRAAPDMWQVINRVMDVGDDPLARLLEEMAVARFFIGADRDRGAPMLLLRELPDQASVPIAAETSWEDLPRRFEPRSVALEPYGSSYLTVDTRGAPRGGQLQIWLRGEFGVGWSLTAVRLREDGTEAGRVRAPVRPNNPRSFIPLELASTDTARVLIVVTNMGSRLADADEPDDQARAFRVILDRQGPS
jgi:hypothetical protein